MSTLLDFKKKVKEYAKDFSLRSVRFNNFFKDNPDIEKLCRHFLDKFPDIFSSLGEVVKALFLGRKIRRCVVCHKHLNYRNSNTMLHERHILTCSKACRMARMNETVETSIYQMTYVVENKTNTITLNAVGERKDWKWFVGSFNGTEEELRHCTKAANKDAHVDEALYIAIESLVKMAEHNGKNGEKRAF